MQTTQTILVCSKCGSDRVEHYFGPHNYDCYRCKVCDHNTEQDWMTGQRSWTDTSDNAGYLIRRIMV